MSDSSQNQPYGPEELPPEAEFLPKPFTPAHLVDRVRETLAG